MDALYPRLLVTRFAECFRFYEAVLPPLVGANLVKGTPEGPYANWDVNDEAVLADLNAEARAVQAKVLAPLDTKERRLLQGLLLRVHEGLPGADGENDG